MDSKQHSTAQSATGTPAKRVGPSQPSPMTGRGFTLVEMTLAITLAALFGVIVAPLLFRIAQQRHLLLQEQFALTQVSNLVDELSVCDFAELPAKAAALQAQGVADPQRLLPDAELSITWTPLESGPDGGQFRCRLQWRDRSGNRLRPLILTGWNYASAGGRP